ncbi:ROK family transcriptional regulator [Paenibacillus senegalensis]|uniref:ROK family transcriptional regulator n=1 Tax=Paenibacillus senegalensis TaxID=1465766 RepID=UPI000289AE95|nr:ROK family protein [Paenibacillus senegalensis]
MSVKGPRILREQNQKKLLALLRRLKRTSRKDLVKKMGVSRNTVSLIVDHFIKEGVIKEVGVEDPGRAGRPTILIEMNQQAFQAVGFTLYHNKIEYMVTDYFLNILEEGTLTNPWKSGREVSAIIVEKMNDLKTRYDAILGIGVGVPGVVDPFKGIVSESTNLKWYNVKLYELLRESIDLPIIIQNNVNMASLCSLELADGKRGSLFYIRVGEGIGGAYLGERAQWWETGRAAAEIGHISVDARGPVCSCGQQGCLERMIGLKTYNSWLKITDGQPLSEKELKQRMEVEMAVYGTYLGISLVNVIHLLNPDKIVIDSPYNVYSAFQDAVKRHLSENALTLLYSRTALWFNDKPFSQSLGAAHAVIHHYESY